MRCPGSAGRRGSPTGTTKSQGQWDPGEIPKRRANIKTRDMERLRKTWVESVDSVLVLNFWVFQLSTTYADWVRPLGKDLLLLCNRVFSPPLLLLRSIVLCATRLISSLLRRLGQPDITALNPFPVPIRKRKRRSLKDQRAVTQTRKTKVGKKYKRLKK